MASTFGDHLRKVTKILRSLPEGHRVYFLGVNSKTLPHNAYCTKVMDTINMMVVEYQGNKYCVTYQNLTCDAIKVTDKLINGQ